VSSVGSFFSYVNDARSHEPEVLERFDTLTYSKEQSLSWETNRFSASQ